MSPPRAFVWKLRACQGSPAWEQDKTTHHLVTSTQELPLQLLMVVSLHFKQLWATLRLSLTSLSKQWFFYFFFCIKLSLESTCFFFLLLTPWDTSPSPSWVLTGDDHHTGSPLDSKTHLWTEWSVLHVSKDALEVFLLMQKWGCKRKDSFSTVSDFRSLSELVLFTHAKHFHLSLVFYDCDTELLTQGMQASRAEGLK